MRTDSFSIENEYIYEHNDCNPHEETTVQLRAQLYLSQPFHSVPRSLMSLEIRFT